MKSFFSFVIPTMWFSDKTECLLNELLKSSLINQIIVIDNNKTLSKSFNFTNKKIEFVQPESNIYVNPSWNLGVLKSVNDNIVICNDDLCIKNIDIVLNEILNSEYDLIGLDYLNLNKSNIVSINNKKGPMMKGFGCFMFIRKYKYIPIPNEIKIHYGDNILHDSIENKGLISFSNIDIELSKTVKLMPNLLKILENDKQIYQREFKHKHRS